MTQPRKAKSGKKRGVRIPEIEDDRGDPYGPSEIDRQPHPRYVPPLKCGGCGSRVGARHGNADDPDGRTSHYFKIDPHKPNCKYDLDQRGKHLVDSSQGTVVRRPGQWRLICPPLDQLGTGGSTKQPATPARPGRARGGGGPRPTSKQTGQAIASARRIVQILNDFRQDPDVAAQFAAIAPNGQRNIPWSEFCHGRGDVDALAQALIDGTAPPIPHAVWGPASTVGAAGRNNDSYVVMYIARQPVHIDGTAVRLRVALRSTTPEWIGATTRSGQFLGYGHWELFPADQARAQRQGWIELQLWVKQPWQVARWDTDGTTVDLPKPLPGTRPRRPPRRPVEPPSIAAPSEQTPPSEQTGQPTPPAATPTRPGASEAETAPAVRQPRQPKSEAAAASTTGDDANTAAAEETALASTDREPAAPPASRIPPMPAQRPTLADRIPPQPAPTWPPLPPYPPPDPGEGGRRAALRRWLKRARRP
ncbi:MULTISPECIES: hypothetical protein [unclassified Streptomyces]|uniref:hypothetical protein n=1 Tax=unclassified Streptomyces TaxID=2593676 RepID=UPI002366B05C|nr:MULTISPECIES: hypothetical protein [unclassified Streptomyces]MDF3141813.1 hypothetical protein [Streptomyces sp. T21Q-yed]WDF45102.1 hypothetical protein PBV52_51295 [Streptomyces sp. T12]